jgi:hypothetical protein
MIVGYRAAKLQQFRDTTESRVILDKGEKSKCGDKP